VPLAIAQKKSEGKLKAQELPGKTATIAAMIRPENLGARRLAAPVKYRDSLSQWQAPKVSVA